MADTAVIARLKAVLSGDSSQLRTDLNRATRNLQDFSKNATQVGRTLTTRLTLPLVGVGVGAVKVAADFEKSMSKITALVGVAADEVASMETQVRSMATTFGKSATEAADALFYITSAGLRGSTATDTLAASLKASAVGLGDTATIADLATSALNAYGSDVLSATEATDVMTAAVREGKLESTELAGSMGRVLPLASAMGVSFNEVGAAFAALSRTGTNAAEAATQVRGILSSLLRPTKQAEEALTGMGLSSEGLRQQIQDEGLLATLKTLADKFGDNEAAAASVFGNIRALSGVLDLMGANVATTEQIFANMADTTGTVDTAFAVMSETASFQFSQAMAEVKESMLTLGQELLPIVTDALSSLTEIIRDVTGWFSQMDDSTKKMVIALGGMLAVMGPLAIGIGLVSKALSGLALANPWVLGLATAFGVLGVAMAHHYGEIAETRSRQEALNEEMRKAGDPAATLIDDMETLAVAFSDVRNAAADVDAEIENFVGRQVMTDILVDEDALETVRRLGIDMETLTEASMTGGYAIGQLRGELKNFDDTNNATINGIAVQNNEIGEMARAFQELTATGQITEDELDSILKAMQGMSEATKLNREELNRAAEEYLRTQAFEDFADIVGVDVVEAAVAAGAAYGSWSSALDDLKLKVEDEYDKLEAASYAEQRYTFFANLAAEATNELSNASGDAAYTLEDMVSGFMAGADAASLTYNQVELLASQIQGIDGFSAAVGIELKTYGEEAIIRVLDEIINLQMVAMGPDILNAPAEFGFGGSLGALMSMRDALSAALDEPSSGRGGGGGGGTSSAIDEVAQAAEEAKRQTDALAQSVANLGDSMMGRDFLEGMFGASPDEIADMFESLVGELDRLGLVTPDNADAIAKLGEKFKAAASAADELAQATQALADAQDELDRRKQVLADLKEYYNDINKEFGLGGKQFRIKKDPLQTTLDQLDDAIPKLRDAQAEVQRLKDEKASYQESVADMFKPQLSADGNVMAQTQRLLGQAKLFKQNLVALKKKGFPPDVLAEVVNAGLIGGAKLGSQLLKMSGGQMNEFLQMRAEIAKIGTETAQIAADVMFNADIANAQGELDKQRTLVENLFKKAIDEAKRQVDDQKGTVNDLKTALEAATAQMQTLVSNIQVELFNSFNNFLNKIGGEVSRLTTSPFSMSWDATAIDRLTNLIAKVTDTTVPAPTPGGGGGSTGGGGTTSPAPTTPTPAPTLPTYTVKSGDGPIAIIKALTGSTSGWSSKAKKLWEQNGLYWRSSTDWQTIHPGQVLNVPAFAKGGRIKSGQLSMVGELGPELFVPDSSGYIVPNHALGGGGSQTVNVTINTHAGMRAEDIVREIEKYTRRRGQVAIPTTSNRRY